MVKYPYAFKCIGCANFSLLVAKLKSSFLIFWVHVISNYMLEDSISCLIWYDKSTWSDNTIKGLLMLFGRIPFISLLQSVYIGTVMLLLVTNFSIRQSRAIHANIWVDSVLKAVVSMSIDWACKRKYGCLRVFLSFTPCI